MSRAETIRIATADGSRCFLDGPDQILDFGWQMAFAGDADTPGKAPRPISEWIDAEVPGTVAGALRKAGQFAWEQDLGLDDRGVLYRCQFRCETNLDGDVALHFLGLATVADVWLNGRQILHSENMFHGHCVDVTLALQSASARSKTHELLIHFRALSDLLEKKRARARWRANFANHRNLRYLRTSLLGRTPGIGPMLPIVGPWRPVVLSQTSGEAVVDVSLKVSLNDGVGEVAGRLVLRRRDLVGEHPSFELRVGNYVESFSPKQSTADTVIYETTLRVPQPSLWWPHTHGEPNLYTASVTGHIDGRSRTMALESVGFRSLDIRKPFEICVNNEPVFCRGLCWMPLDFVSMNPSHAHLRATLERIRDAGINMLRISGDTAYESDDFLGLCDELGIMVWQDFMFARFDYPTEDPEFKQEIVGEAQYQLQRAAHRPSLAVVCGNAEVQQSAAMQGMPEEMMKDTWFDEELRELCRSARADVPYVPSSPSGRGMPFHTQDGVSHFFGLGAFMRDPAEARLAPPRFATECLAFANPHATQEARTPDGRVPRDRGASFDFMDVTNHYVERVFGLTPEELSAEPRSRRDHIRAAATTRLVEETLAGWRHPGSFCRGALIWTCKDLWPSRGWGVLDEQGIPKPVFSGIRRACQPVTLAFIDQGLNGLVVGIYNDSVLAIEATLKINCVRLDGTIVAQGEHVIACGPRDSLSLGVEEVIGSFIDASYAYKFGPPQFDAVVAELHGVWNQRELSLMRSFLRRDLHLLPKCTQQVNVSFAKTGDDSQTLELTAASYAQAVELDIPGCEVGDNYFDLPPGRTARISIRPIKPELCASVRVTPLNSDEVLASLA